MIDIPLIPSTASQNAPLQAVSAVNKIIGTLSQGLLNLPVGTLLNGIITQRDANGNTTLNTTKGTVLLNTPLMLNPGNEVSFKILSEAPNLQVQLATINGTPVTKESLPALLGNPQDVKPSLQLTSSGNDPTVFKTVRHHDAPPLPEAASPNKSVAIQTTIHAPYTGSFIQGKFVTLQPKALDVMITQALQAGVITSTASLIPQGKPVTTSTGDRNAPAPSAKNLVAPGSTAVFRIIAGSIPTTMGAGPPPAPLQTTQPTQPAPPPTTAGNTPLLSGVTPAVSEELAPSTLSGGYASSPASGSTVTQPPRTIPLTTAMDTPFPASPSALQVKGTVIGTEISGESILKTPLGIVRLPANIALPKGAELLLELVTITPLPQAAITSNAPLSRHDAVIQLFAHWASLDDSLTTLQEQAPQLADTMLKSLIPSTDKHFTANLLNFITSVKDGNITNWLGMPIIRQLKESGKREMLDKLTQEFTALKNLYTEPSQVNNWQTLLFPIYDGEELHQVHMFVRDHPSSDEEGETGRDTRFVVEIDTEMLGALQFDGLVHSEPRQKNFDLVIRSQHPLPNWMKNDITSLFTSAGDITGMRGNLTFQATPDFPLKPIEDVLGNDHNSIIV